MVFHTYFFAVLIVLLHQVNFKGALTLQEERASHQGQPLSDNAVITVASLANVSQFEAVLNKILIPRVVGTKNHKFVRQYLKTVMKNLGWHVESDQFKADTPIFGPLEFENIIAKLNPNARRYLVFACHFDSKYFREGGFVGATDSAVPCAMMINLAHTMKRQLETIKNQNDVSLKFIFFDGEEAFQHWSQRDSIYGSRHLARKWERIPFPKNNRDGTNYIHSLDMIVLLDLLGAPDPAFYSFFKNTERWYLSMAAIEQKLGSLHQLEKYSYGQPEQRYFKQLSHSGGIEDDHIPFLKRGVPILHLIPYPFPDVWHTEGDNRNVVDLATVENLSKILRVFTAEYLGIAV